MNRLNKNISQMQTSSSALRYFSETLLPTEFGQFRVVVFQEDGSEKEHLAIVKGDVHGNEEVLIRVHSECFTGEVLHSMKCDCREQLEFALKKIEEKGKGMVVYLRQEGRGIGLGNKIRAYALQEKGYDTVDANRLLGFSDDQRTYEGVGQILAYFGVKSVHLMTNNPSKIDQLRGVGVIVAKRVPIFCDPNQHSLGYFQTKKKRMGHMFTEDILFEKASKSVGTEIDKNKA